MIGIWFTGDNDDAHSGNLAIVTYTCIFTEICAKNTYLRLLRLIFPVPFRPRPRSFFALIRSKQKEQTAMGYNYQVTFSSSVTHWIDTRRAAILIRLIRQIWQKLNPLYRHYCHLQAFTHSETEGKNPKENRKKEAELRAAQNPNQPTHTSEKR